jgi:hypothetical protein
MLTIRCLEMKQFVVTVTFWDGRKIRATQPAVSRSEALRYSWTIFELIANEVYKIEAKEKGLL